MEIIQQQEDVEQTPIQTFYNNENILITGGTGFLGKALIEKLLRSCKDINTIYLLVRPKKGKIMHVRVEELFDDPVFERLKEMQPKFRHKIQGIAGDCSLPGLGLSNSDRELLQTEVSIVFHVAATVKFDEKLRLATAINVQGPKSMIELSRNMNKLKSVVHVSTAYAQCINSDIGEKFYPTPLDANKLIEIVNTTEDRNLENLTPNLLGKWPNTYTFTKAVAEDYIRLECADIPIGIYRPAIVISSYKEPVRGWIDNMYGPTGITVSAGTGLLHSLYCEPDAKANIVPVDMCVNALICSSWQVHNEHKKLMEEKITKTEEDIPIYNYVSNEDKPISWGNFTRLSEKYGLWYPSSRAIWYYSFTLNTNYYIHMLYILFLQLIPALLMDGILLCFGKSPQLFKMNKRITKFTLIIKYFTVQSWKYSNNNIKQLLEDLEPEDRHMYQFDMNELDWDDYCRNYVKGIRTYLLQEPLKTLPDAIKRWNRLYWLHQITKFVFYMLLLRFFWFCFTSLV